MQFNNQGSLSPHLTGVAASKARGPDFARESQTKTRLFREGYKGQKSVTRFSEVGKPGYPGGLITRRAVTGVDPAVSSKEGYPSETPPLATYFPKNERMLSPFHLCPLFFSLVEMSRIVDKSADSFKI